MVYEEFMQNKDPSYKPLSLRKVLKKFKTDSKGMLEMRKGEEYKREERKRARLLRSKIKPKIGLKQEEEQKETPKEIVQVPGMDETITATGERSL